MDDGMLMGLLPFWLLVAPPVLLLVSTMMDGTWSRNRVAERNRY